MTWCAWLLMPSAAAVSLVEARYGHVFSSYCAALFTALLALIAALGGLQ